MSLKNLFLSPKSELELFRSALMDLIPEGKRRNDEIVKIHIARIREGYSKKGISPFQYFWELNEDRNGRIIEDPTIQPKKRKKRPGQERPVIQIHLLTKNQIAEYPSIKEAGAALGYPPANIGHCCRGGLKTAYGYIWKFKNEY